MFLKHAFVHYYQQTGFSGLSGGRFVDDAFLHPDCPGPNLDGLLHNSRYIFRSAEDIDHIHRFGDGRQVGIGDLI